MIYVRKSIYDLDAAERASLRQALQAVKDSGFWDKLVRQHATAMARKSLMQGEVLPALLSERNALRNAAHRGPAFLPWHRHFLFELEKQMRLEVPGITLPYWPWERDAPLLDPAGTSLWSDEVLGTAANCPFPNPADFCLVSSGEFADWVVVRQRFALDAAGNIVVVETNPDGSGGVPVPDLDADGDPQFVDGGAVGDLWHVPAVPLTGIVRQVGDKPVQNNAGIVVGTIQLPSLAEVMGCLEYATYDVSPWDDSSGQFAGPAAGSFRNRLEGWAIEPGESPVAKLHNVVHGWVGGDMGPGTSPNDPVFFLHHCNVDRIWAMWQERRRLETNAPYDSHYLPTNNGPPGHNIDDEMFPWNGDPKYPGEPLLTPRGALDYVASQGFIYDDVPVIAPHTTQIDFGSVVQGQTQWRAARFDVTSAYPVHFEVVGFGPGAGGATDFSLAQAPTSAVPDPINKNGEGVVWIEFAAIDVGPVAMGQSVQIRGYMNHPSGNLLWEHTFELSLGANVVARPEVASVLVLDQSNSMNFDAGNGNLRKDVLAYSAPVFLALLDSPSAVGVVAFDQNAYERSAVAIAPGGAASAANAVAAHEPNPLGNTSIADGIELAHQQLASFKAANEGYDGAIVVLTDGHETASKWLADLDASVLSERVFAIGLGSYEQIQPDRLAQIAGGRDGYVLLTGSLDSSPDDTDLFLLRKYYLQILAAVTNTEVVHDPEGRVGVGEVRRVPFDITAADYTADVILLTEHPIVDFQVETPGGQLIDVQATAVLPQARHVEHENMRAYRLQLPLVLGNEREHVGRWNAVMRLDPRRAAAWIRRKLATLSQKEGTKAHAQLDIKQIPESLREEVEEIVTRGARYSVSVHAKSNLSMQARLDQEAFRVGSTTRLMARITEYGVPLLGEASVRAEIQRPDGSTALVTLEQERPGEFGATLTLFQAGTWRLRVVATGRTVKGHPFVREHLLSAGTWQRAGESDPRPSLDRLAELLGDQLGRSHERWCELATCLLARSGVREALKRHQIDAREIVACFEDLCKEASSNSKSTLDPSIRKVLLEILAQK